MKISYYITDIEQIDSNEYQEVVVNAVQRLLSLYDDEQNRFAQCERFSPVSG